MVVIAVMLVISDINLKKKSMLYSYMVIVFTRHPWATWLWWLLRLLWLSLLSCKKKYTIVSSYTVLGNSLHNTSLEYLVMAVIAVMLVISDINKKKIVRHLSYLGYLCYLVKKIHKNA